MKKILNICVAILLLISATPVAAQQIYNKQINVTSSEVKKTGSYLYIRMILDLKNLKMDRNRSLALTPILTNDDKIKELPEILINGTTRHKVYLRSVALSNNEANSSTAPYKVVKLDNKDKGILHYEQTIPYEEWMNSVKLDIKEDLCGCGGHDQVLATERITERIPPLPYIMQPELSYIQPEVEKIKARSEKWEVFLDFPVSKTDILPDYMNNQAELSALESMLKTIRSDKNLTVKQIDIAGFASPEGSIAFNEKLSKSRAEALKEFMVTRTEFPSNIYNVTYGGENWDGLTEAIERLDIGHKNEILNIIKNTSDISARKNKLKSLDKGIPYRQMLTEIYPKLRKVICTASYEVRSFNIDEARVIIKTHPQQLSLEEMYHVANTYPKGSDEFIDVFDTAVRMYPTDNIANLNAAAAALSKGDMAKAENYLKKANNNSAEYANNMGVLYMLHGDLTKAKEEFMKASQKGLKTAVHNLQEIEKKMETDQQ